MRWIEALAYSSVWVALAAGALCAAAAEAMAGKAHGMASALAICGTLVIYNLDRLRDLERDHTTAPLRSAFVSRHRSLLIGLTSLAALASAVLGALLGSRAIAALLPVLLLGLLHRRLKSLSYAKPFYIALAWVVVTVMLPAVLLDVPGRASWVAGIFGLTILANVIACNLRDGEAASAALGAGVPLRLARLTASAGLLTAFLAPDFVRPLALVPLLTLGALLPFDPGERYGHLVVDGALLVGATAALGVYAA